MPTYSEDLLPNTTGLNLGSPTQQWDAYIRNLTVSGTLTGQTSGGSINPTNNVIPKRQNATTFVDSALTDDGTTITIIEPTTINSTPVSSTFNGVTANALLSSFYNNVATSAGIKTGIFQVTNVNPSGSSSADTRGIYVDVRTPITNSQNISGRVNGIQVTMFPQGSGNLTRATRSLCGVESYISLAGGNATDIRGIDSLTFNASSGSGTTTSVSSFRGVSGIDNNGGAATTTFDITYYADAPSKAATYTMTHHYAYFASQGHTGGVGNPDGWAFVVQNNSGGDRSQFGPVYWMTLALGNFAAGGSIGSAATTVDIYPSINIAQTTAGQTLTLPSPTLATAGTFLYINNIGSASFTILSTIVLAGKSLVAVWTGAAWAPTSSALAITTVDLTAQTASIGTTTLYAVPAVGVYRVSYYVKITTAGSTSGSVSLAIGYTDRDDSVAVTFTVASPTNATDSTSVASGTLVLDAKASTNITYATTYASSGGTAMVYKLRLKLEAL